MNRLLFYILITLLLPLSADAVTPMKSREAGYARAYARDFLVSSGADPTIINLTLEEYTEYLAFFNDMYNNLFVLMVRDEYAPLVKESVLAFSIGTPHSKARDTETFMLLMQYYDNLIKQMHEGTLPKEVPTAMDKLRVKPMLHNIRWRQFGLRNVFDGQQGSVISGCGAVAVGQLMAYYCWPDTVRHDFSYVDSQKRLLRTRMDGQPIVWKNMKNIYFFHDKDSASLAPLMKVVGPSIMSNYGVSSTSSHSRNMKRALAYHFGYSPEMFNVFHDHISEATMLRLIRQEISSGRPCILSGGNHHFVCDGAFDGFLHLNMGWSGSYDGWYRFPMTGGDAINPKAFIETALLNIAPMETAGKDTTVTLTKAGTLDKVLSEADFTTITKLKVNGPINGNDIKILRRMAGYVEDKHLFSWKGRLMNLDLSAAEIVSDSTFFYETEAYLKNMALITKDGYCICSDISNEYWQNLKQRGLQNREFSMTEVIPDSAYIMHFKTRNGYISSYLFYGCSNLQQLQLPQNTMIVALDAFRECVCLSEITIPSSVNRILNSFPHCPSMQRVRVCRDAPYFETLKKRMDNLNQTYLPFLTIEVDTTMQLHADIVARQNKPAAKEQAKQQPSDKNKKYYQMGGTYKSTYKMVNGKRVLVKRTLIK